ncbi:ABC transporter ATP-binding protein [Leptolyngbya sp. AN02str]|uniref:ABC transporter ATP-binding protein n=1 Tax=Leptolyngbya sp. AN02str TaxID=3423363 RepID=UPI003D316099
MAPQSDSLVYLDHVSKIYRSGNAEVYAARNVTLDVKAGEFYSLLGSSGSGKTTTLRMIGGFEVPEYGTVYVGGEDVTTLPPYRRNVHTVFQNYALFPHMTVAENVAYPLAIARTPCEEIDPRVRDVLKMFQIEALRDRRPAQLSGGQQQRVALARAIINRPKVLLLDEPLSALDAKIREEVRQELRAVQRQTDLTFIYVTHDQEEAMALSDRIAVMHNGEVQQIGTPHEIYNLPRSPFVAQFIGKANFLQGTLVEQSGDRTVIRVQDELLRAQVPHESVMQLATGEAVTLMIRPERIRLNASSGEHDNSITGMLLHQTYIGQLRELTLQTPVGQLIVTQLGQQALFAEGAIALSWNVGDCLVLPRSDAT